MSAVFPQCNTAEELLAQCVQLHLHPSGKSSAGGPAEVVWVSRQARWQDIALKVSVASLGLFKGASGPFRFEYLNESNDAVAITTQEQWEKAILIGGVSHSQMGVKLHLMITPLGEVYNLKAAAGCCTGSSNSAVDCDPSTGCCKPEFSNPCDFSQSTSCCSSGNQDSNIPKGRCRPMPDELPPREVPKGPVKKIVNPTLSQQKYSGEFLRAVTLPLGPLGGGVISVAGDGGLRQWQVSNVINHVGHVPDSFFGIKVETGTATVSKILQSDALYGPPPAEFVPAPYVTDHLVPPASVELLKSLPFGVPEIEITARYPVVEVEYPNSGLPVDVRMEAFNPCIPFDSKESGYPAIIFNFHVANNTSKDVQVSLLNSQQNFVGWDGHSVIKNEVENASYGGNSNIFTKTKSYYAVQMSNSKLDTYHVTNGQVATAVVPQSDHDIVGCMVQSDSAAMMWKHFISSSGLPGQGSVGVSPGGRTWNGAISLTRLVRSKTTEVFTFILAWHFPHRYVNWSQQGFGIPNKDLLTSKFYLGNQYATFWPTIDQVLTELVANLERLSKLTRTFRDAMFTTTMPWQLVDSAAGRISPVRSPCCMWLGDGRFYGFEGCSTYIGCCPLNCTHVWNYEMSLARLWPDLERTMREVEFKQGQMCPDFQLMSRVTVPLELRRWFTFFPDYHPKDNDTAACVDGEIGAVLKVYREVRMGASKAWLDTMWPGVQGILSRWMNTLDTVISGIHTGMVFGAQPNTYDTSIYGFNTFTGALYLCALRAGEELAKIEGNAELAAAYHERFVTGKANLDAKCFTNGKWYTQVVNEAHMVELLTDSTFIDCLLGQWWGHALALGDILPNDHCRSTCDYIFMSNHRDSFNKAEQAPRKFYDENDSGLFVARWPDGKIPKNAMLYTSEGAWTGLEHEYAGLCLYQGQIDIALQVEQEARERHDGGRRSPWNELECGDHYVRPMSGFQLFDAVSGMKWQLAPAGLHVTFKPIINPDNFQGFFSLTEGWGQFLQTRNYDGTGVAQLNVMYGKVVLTQLDLPSFFTKDHALSVHLGNIPLHVTQGMGTQVSVVFQQPVTVSGMGSSSVLVINIVNA